MQRIETDLADETGQRENRGRCGSAWTITAGRNSSRSFGLPARDFARLTGVRFRCQAAQLTRRQKATVMPGIEGGVLRRTPEIDPADAETCLRSDRGGAGAKAVRGGFLERSCQEPALREPQRDPDPRSGTTCRAFGSAGPSRAANASPLEPLLLPPWGLGRSLLRLCNRDGNVVWGTASQDGQGPTVP
jgi:hypothetical protein